MFVKFLDQDRHDHGDFNYSIEQFLNFDFRGMRRFLDAGPAQRSVLLGAVFSPACYLNKGPFDASCIWGCGSVGSWNHICWECSARPSTLEVADPIQKRFG